MIGVVMVQMIIIEIEDALIIREQISLTTTAAHP